MKIILFLSTILLALLFAQCATEKNIRQIGFYNVENLFDTIDGSNDDAEFLPNGKNTWNAERYNEKLKHINQVIDQWENPLLIGLCEIENATVVRDIMRASSKINNYGLVHYESPDERGIDVALVYDSSSLTMVESGYLRFKLPTDETHPTRDILWAKFALDNDTLIAMINHWPSRSGGQTESEVNRIAAATRARLFIDSILTVNKDAKIIFMGDLNDYPRDSAPKLIAEKLNPQITSISGEFGGSYNYKGEWDVLDHILISNGLNFKKGISIVENSGCIHSYDFLLEEYKGSIVPFRTYAGTKYLGGYSDHFPVSVEISIP